MSHRRDARRTSYLKAVARAAPGRFRVRTSPTGLDDVLYDPGRLVCAPPPGADGHVDVDPVLLETAQALIRSKLEELGGTGSGESKPPAESGRLRGIYEPQISEQAPQQGESTEPRAPAGCRELRPRIFDLPAGLDSCALAEELQGRWRDQCAPIYYSLTQQNAQPGEDPEAGQPVQGLHTDETSPPGTGPGHGIVIAVIDTGIDRSAVRAGMLSIHGSTDDELDELFDPTVDPPAPPLLGPAAGHGTFIASLITCVAPGALVRSYRVADPLGFCDEEVIAAKILLALGQGEDEDKVQVINLSLGGYPFADQPGLPTLRAFAVLEAAIAQIPDDVAVVAAAGNCGSPEKFYPAAFDDRVIGVAALDGRYRLWDHSNYGDWVKACTSGVNLRGLFVAGSENPVYDTDRRPETWADPVNFATWSGTSFAAPLVAAQIAILAAEFPELTARQAGDKLLAMSKAHSGTLPCGKRICVDLPGQT